MRRLDHPVSSEAPVRHAGGASLSQLSRLLGPAKWLAGSVLGLALCSSLTAQPGGATVQVIHVGTLHPVSGPVIENALVVLQGDKILQIRPAGGRVPDGVLSFPDAHAYPGFVDLDSAAFADDELLSERSVDAGTEIAPGLDPFDAASREIVRHGVTTAYVHNRSTSLWRGQGAIVRPDAEGFDLLDGDQPVVLHYRIDTSGAHPLQRLEQLQGLGNEFEQLEKYEEALEKFETEKAEYDEALKKYLAYHRKKNGIPEPAEEPEGGEEETTEESPATNEESPASGEGGNGGETPPAPRPRRGRNGGEGRQGGQRPEGGGDQNGGESGESSQDGDDKDAPKKPDYPREPKRDPAKDALIKLRDGEARLFVDARHPADIRRATEIIAEQELAGSVLEAGDAAAACIDDIVSYFSGVVVTQVTPVEKSPTVPEDAADVCVAVVCERAGVPVAIASGSLPRARNLRSIAAEAVGRGLSEHGALRAITLTPAEMLGIEDRVGSLEPGKVADLNLFSGPIFDPTSRPVAVFRSGIRLPLDQ